MIVAALCRWNFPVNGDCFDCILAEFPDHPATAGNCLHPDPERKVASRPAVAALPILTKARQANQTAMILCSVL
jgi:hypothetical protein